MPTLEGNYQMPCWYFEKDELLHSPSEADGINAETESRYREEGAGFIIELANRLGIRYDTYAAAVVYFHRFHVLQSFRNFHRHVTATSCLLLSSKTQENKTTLRDLLKTIKLLLSEKQFSVFGTDPQQEVIRTETSLPETLKFDLDVIHPYAYLLHYTKLLKGDREKIQQVLHTSWTFVNDSLYTTLCVQYEPDLLAVAFLYLGCRLTKFEVTDWLGRPDSYDGKWYSHFVSDMNVDILKDICGQVLGLYSKGRKEAPLVTRTSSSRGREARSPSPAARSSRRRSGSPGQRRRSGRRSLSPLPRRPADSHSVGRSRLYDSERSPPLRTRRSSHSRSRSHHRRGSYSRSPEWRRRDRSPLPRSPSPRSPAAVRAPPEAGTFFLSRESFEEIQAQLRAKSGQQPAPEHQYWVALPPPPRFSSFQEPMRPSVPPSYPPVSFHPPPQSQAVVAFPYQPPPPPAMPPASHPHFPPGAGFPQRPPEFVGTSQILVHHQPTVMTRPVMTLHPTHIPPPHNPEIHVYGRPPGPFPEARGPFPDARGPFPDARGPFPPRFEGPPPPPPPPPPPGVPGYMQPPPNQDMHVFVRPSGPFPSPDGPPRHMLPPVPSSPSGEVLFGRGEGSMIETSPDGKRWMQNNKKSVSQQRPNLISLGSLYSFNDRS